MEWLKKNTVLLLLISVSSTLYFWFAYFLERSSFNTLITLFFILFFAFLFMLKDKGDNDSLLKYASLFFRLIFLFAIPSLSQDFYRFIWDGQMIMSGYNPFVFNPAEFLVNPTNSTEYLEELRSGMGELSASNYSNYPPLNQLCFLISTLISPNSILGSVIIMRLIIIAADIGTLFYGRKLLKGLNLNPKLIYLYILNPFIIIELTGNLHFEGVMIFFLILGLYLLQKGNWVFSSLAIGASISVKLLPLMLLPLFFQRLKWRQLMGFYTIIGVFNLILFMPFFSSQLIEKYTQTVGLWFQKFEFNASLYYVAREIGYTFRGYNEIAIIGSYIPKIVLGFILLITFFRKNKTMIQLSSAMLICLSFYFFTSTTVHPWYIATLMALSIFTKYRFPLIWSLFIMLSYSAYNNEAYQENFWLIGLEYGIVYAVFFYEIFFRKSLNSRVNPA